MDCPKCNSTSHVKQGHVGSRQRHKCKNCGYMYTVLFWGKPKEIKEMALRMYLEGIGFRGIGRLLKVSQVSVMNWIRKFGERAVKVAELTGDSKIVELDEIFTFVGLKKTTFGSGRQLTVAEKSLLISKLANAEFEPEKGSTKRLKRRLKKRYL